MNSPLLGLDLGLRRTGVALSESGVLAKPLTTIEWHPPHAHQLIETLVELVRRHEVQTIVVGMPLDEDGAATTQAEKTSHLVGLMHEGLEKATLNVEVVELNEYHSTQDARELYPDVDKDAAAAAVILQQYLDENGGGW